MKIALLSDVHANLPALEAVIAHARAHHVDEFWDLGDRVGYGSFPNETVQTLQQVCSRSIVGNYDLKVLSDKFIKTIRDSGRDPDKIFSFVWTHETLTKVSRDILIGLEGQARVTVDGARIVCVHGSPDGVDDILTPRTSMSKFQVLANKADADLVLCGHTHETFDRTAGGVRFINPGGVGRSFDGDPRASYGVLEIVGGKVRFKSYRVDYDRSGLLEKMREHKFPQRLIQSLSTGRSLEDLEARAGEDKVLQGALDLARECRYEKAHAHQVTRLALRIFDDLASWHQMGLRERLWLQVATLLHDVGVVYGPSGHHKASRDIILKASRLPLTDRERMIVALTARYHRRSCPKTDHQYYRDLPGYDQERVDMLSAILRVADGLDRRHQGVVEDVSVRLTDKQIMCVLQAVDAASEEIAFALEKGDLLRQIFGRELIVTGK